ncbi:MAG: HAMP domain-containing protein [Nitrospirae bacterium]|nr:HAMP domain-containing protein [Nitrospirota bacterium]
MFRKLGKGAFSLQGKFILVASVCLLAFTVIGSFLILSREKKLYMKDIINQGNVLAEISRLTLTNVMVYKDLGIMDEQGINDYLDYYIMNLMERDKRVRYMMITDDKGRVLAQSDLSQRDEADKSILNTITTLKAETTDEIFLNEPVLKITTPLNIDTKLWGALRLGLSTNDVTKSIDALKQEVIFINLVFSVIALIGLSLGAKVLAKPVIRLSNVMDNIKTYGDLESVGALNELPLLKDRSDEIGELQKSFLWMLQRLREADKEHKKTMEVLSQTEKMVSIGRIASGIAHEINNPLGGITLCFKNLIGENADNRTKEKLIEAINDGLQKIKNIVEQLLDFSRMSVTEKTPVDINSLINRLLVFFNYAASKKDIRIVNDFADEIPPLLIDGNKMSQVFMNIIINAVQSMEKGGALTIRTGLDNGFCVISFEDTGKGMPPEVMANVFEPFITTKGVGEGTGLGLSVSKGIVEQHGGIIDVDSKVGVGTTFRIKLPV